MAMDIGTQVYGTIKRNNMANKIKKVGEEQIRESEEWKKKADATDITFRTPLQIKQMESEARSALGAQDDVLEATKAAASKRVAETANAAERTATSGAQALAAVSGAQDKGMESIETAAAEAQTRKDANRDRLTRAQQLGGQYAEKEFDINQMYQYQQAMNFYSQLKGSGQKNIMGSYGMKAGASTDLASGVSGSLQAASGDLNELVSKLIPGL
jgi:hypothetical protein